jgi:hypothetical protein
VRKVRIVGDAFSGKCLSTSIFPERSGELEDRFTGEVKRHSA